MADSDAVIALLGEALKLSPRQRWYLAEGLANSIGHELEESSDDNLKEALERYNAHLLPGERELDAWVKSL